MTKPQSPSFASKKRRVNMSSDIMNTTQSSDHSDASSEVHIIPFYVLGYICTYVSMYVIVL